MIFGFRRKKKKQMPEDSNSIHIFSASAPTHDKSPLVAVTNTMLYMPKLIGEEVQLYRYGAVPFMPVENAATEILKLANAKSWDLDYKIQDENCALLHDGVLIGTLTERYDMICDWHARGDTIKILLQSYCANGNATVNIGFYRNEEARISYREATTTKLIGYAGKDAQMELSCASERAILTAVEDVDDNGNDIINILGDDVIGRLPKKAAARYLSEGAARIFLDRVEYDEEKDKYIPYVKIYW